MATAAAIGAWKAVTVGTLGSARASGAAAGKALATSLGLLCVANGALAGGASTSAALGGTGGAGANTTGAVGDITAAGAPGEAAGYNNNFTAGGNGGSSIFGGGGMRPYVSAASSVAGNAAGNYGS